jgi:hypothetical protein
MIMASRFAHLRAIFEQPTAPERQQTRAEREAERAQSRTDMAFGRRTFLEQQAKQAAESDPQAQREAFYKAQALKIVRAGALARGLPVPTRRLATRMMVAMISRAPRIKKARRKPKRFKTTTPTSRPMKTRTPKTSQASHAIAVTKITT